MHRTRLPLTTWMYALWQLAVRKTSLCAVQLQRDAGIGSDRSAWGLLHKVRLVLGERASAPKLGRDAVEVDETKLFGRGNHGAQVGRGLAPGSTWVVAAVEQIERDKGGKSWLASGSARLAVITDTTKATLCGFVEASVVPGTPVITESSVALWFGGAVIGPGSARGWTPLRCGAGSILAGWTA